MMVAQLSTGQTPRHVYVCLLTATATLCRRQGTDAVPSILSRFHTTLQSGLTPLMAATVLGRHDLLHFLLKRGATTNVALTGANDAVR